MMWYEWKKIFGRRLNMIAMLSGYILIIICIFAYISQETFYDEKMDSYIEGTEAFRLEQMQAMEQTRALTEEYITGMVQEIQDHGMDLESDEAYCEVIRPLGDIFYVVAKNYTDMRADVVDRNALMEVNLEEGAHFYEQRMKKITDYLNMDFSYGNYKEEEKEYWLGKAEQTNIPFRWGSMTVMDGIWSLVAVGFYLCFVIVICTSSVFSSEYESGAASLLLTTKYGKDRLIWSKIAVAVLFTVVYLVTGILLAVGSVGVLVGFPGADLPVQLWNTVIPYNLTIGQACFWNFALVLLMGVTITLILLWCSAGLRSSFATLVIGMVVLIAPAFFKMSKKSGLWNHINYLFPVRAMNLKEMLGAFVSYPVGNYVIPYVAMVVIVYALIGIGALLLIRRGFVRLK